MSSKLLAALAVSATLFATTSARADDAPVEADKPQTETKRWYGYQTLATDAGALALLGLAIAADDGSTSQVGFLAASGATFVGAPAVVHGLHGNPGRAVGDVALRLFTPPITMVVGGLIGVATADRGDGFEALGGLLIGGTIGFVGGIAGCMALDAAVLAYEKVPASERAEKKPVAKAGATVTPSFGPTRSGFAAGLSATF